MLVGVNVLVGDGVRVAVGVDVGVAVEVGVGVAVDVAVGVAVGVDVAVDAGVFVGVEVGEAVLARVGVVVPVEVDVDVGVLVGVGVTIDVGAAGRWIIRNGNVYKRAPPNKKAVPAIANPFCLFGGISMTSLPLILPTRAMNRKTMPPMPRIVGNGLVAIASKTSISIPLEASGLLEA